MTETLMQKVAEVAPEKFAFLNESATIIDNGPFRDEVVDEMAGILKAAAASQGEIGEKLAFGGFGAIQKGLGSFASGMGQAASAVGANPVAKYIGSTVAAGVALSLAGDLYDAARRGLTKSRHWSEMLEANPDLADQSKTNPMVKSVFNTLHRFNPEFSGDPFVAGSWVKQRLEYPDDMSAISGLVKSHQELKNSGGLRPPGGIQLKGPHDSEEQRLRMEGTQASTQNAKAQAFKNRQEGQSAYNERMGMGSQEQMEQARRRGR